MRSGFRLPQLLLCSLALAAAACGGGGGGGGSGSGTGIGATAPLAARPTGYILRYNPGQSVGSVAVAGEWNGFSTTADRMSYVGGNTWEALIDEPPDEYGYKFVVGGTDWRLDPENPYHKYVSGSLNSALRADDHERPELVPEVFEVDSRAGTLEAVVAYRDGSALNGPDLGSLTVTLDRVAVSTTTYSWIDTNHRWHIQLSGLAPGKHVLRMQVSEAGGKRSDVLYLPGWVESEAFRWEDGVIYFVMTDRFLDGNSANTPAPQANVAPIADYMGGDWAGVTQKIQSGYFDDLGVNVLWLSAPNWGPDYAYLGNDGQHWFTGYHGYWPRSFTETDPRLGSLAELRALVDAAHDRGIRVIFDLVGNHVHTEHPDWTAHRNDGWFNTWEHATGGDPACVCADTGPCTWNGSPEECWFAAYLPDLDYHNHDVVQAMADSAIHWLRETDADGFRMDAVKHMPSIFGTYIRARVQDELGKTGHRYYFVGETYVGEHEHATIMRYVGPDELDGQFDFPLYYHVLRTFALDDEDMNGLAGGLHTSLLSYGDAPMSTFLGNHDVPRFISHVTEKSVWANSPNGARDFSWQGQPVAPSTGDAYERLRLAFAFLFTAPNLPLIYYGDEIGMPGAADPDNRRMMRFGAQLSAYEQDTLDAIRALGQLRASSETLRRGGFSDLWRETDFFAYARKLPGQPAWIVALNRHATNAHTFTIPLSAAEGLAVGTTMTERLHGGTATVTAIGLPVTVPPRTALVFQPN